MQEFPREATIPFDSAFNLSTFPFHPPELPSNPQFRPFHGYRFRYRTPVLTSRVLPRFILDPGANSALPAIAPLAFIRPLNTSHCRHQLYSRPNRVIQGSFLCICLRTFTLPARSFSRILEGDCAPKNSASHNPFETNESRTLGIFATKCASTNSFAINSFRTLLQKPWG